MKALIYADLQATVGHEMLYGNPNKSLQLYRIEKFFGDIFEIYHDHGCDTLWDLGDTTDDRSSIPIPALSLVCDELRNFMAPKMKAPENSIKLIGNHEQYLRNAKMHTGPAFFPFFDHVVDSHDTFCVDGLHVGAFSYPDSYETLTFEIKKFIEQTKGEPNIILGHFDVTGAGLTASKSQGGVDPSVFRGCDAVFLGHIHKPQTIKKNIHYIGSPFQQNWGESGENKSVIVANFEKGNTEFKRVTLEDYPVYKNVTFEEFNRLAAKDGEDRYKVVLNSIEEAEEFYRHPLSYRVREPVYNFSQSVMDSIDDVDDLPSVDNLMRGYLKLNPAEDAGIADVDDETLLHFGNYLKDYVQK